jgi:hypothetical protein
MPDRETRITGRFQVERQDGSRETVTEQTTFLIHKGNNHRAPIQIDWYLNGDSLIRDQLDHSVFRNGITGETLRRVPWAQPQSHYLDEPVSIKGR